MFLAGNHNVLTEKVGRRIDKCYVHFEHLIFIQFAKKVEIIYMFNFINF